MPLHARSTYYEPGVMPMGKWKGYALPEIPVSYLAWALEEWEFNNLDDLRCDIENEVRDRVGVQDARETQPDGCGRIPPEADAATAKLIIAEGRKALALKHHPDNMGGDLETMQGVNANADWLALLVGKALGK